MKKKFLIPVAGLFMFAMALSFTNSSNDENDTLFLESDNIAFAESGAGGCITGSGRCVPGDGHIYWDRVWTCN